MSLVWLALRVRFGEHVGGGKGGSAGWGKLWPEGAGGLRGNGGL